MKSLLWLLALLIDFVVAMAFVASVFEAAVPAGSRAVGAGSGLLFLAVCGLLVAGRMHRLPSWGRSAMKGLCSAIPISWLLGALDHGTVSGLEFLSLVFAGLLGWGSWRAFLLFAPRPDASTDPAAAG